MERPILYGTIVRSWRGHGPDPEAIEAAS